MTVLPALRNTNSRYFSKKTEHLSKTLETYIPKTGYNSPEVPWILNLRCDLPYGFKDIRNYFGKSKGAFLIAVDNEEKPIADARKLYTGQGVYAFLRGDVSDLGKVFRKQFDVIVARNQRISKSSIWREMFNASRDKMKSDGILIATSFNNDEHDALQTLPELGYRILLSCSNEYAVPLTRRTSIDKHILIAKKI